MNPRNISMIPELSLQSFLAILQSIARFEKAKKAILPVPYMRLDVFANKTWQELGCSIHDLEIIIESYNKMFSIKQTQPDLQSSFGTFAENCYNLWKKSEQTLTFFTSGSTGIPKPCTHHESHLRQELVGVLPNLHNCKRALITVPQHHLYGFTFGLLLPQALQIPIQSEVPFPSAISEVLEKNDLLVAIPLLYDHLCNIPDLQGNHISCISGTAPLAEGTFAKMLAKGFTFIEHFGSSELGVMCFRKTPHDAYTLLPHFVGVNTDGSINRVLPNGDIVHCPSQDNIEWIDERHLISKGRKDFAVQVGSVNVFPSHVREILESHSMIKQCIVRLMRPEEGNRLKAFIVPNLDMDETTLRKNIRDFMQNALSSAERPTSITFGLELPRNLIGKPTDW